MPKSQAAPPCLGYWAIRGLAQPIRLLLKYVNEEFEEKLYEQGEGPEFSRETWYREKYTLGLPFPNLPYYIDGDIKITQSNAILRYIGRKHNLLGSNEEEMVKVDVMENQLMDFRNGLVHLCYNPNYNNLKDEYFKNVKEQLKMFELFLGENKWLVGNKITFVDFPMYELLDQHQIMKPDILDDYPKLTEFLKRFESLPVIKDYMQSKGFMKRPLNNKRAQFK